MRINAKNYPILAWLRNPRNPLEVMLPEGEMKNGGYEKSKALFDMIFDYNSVEQAELYAANIDIISREFMIAAWHNRDKIETPETLAEFAKGEKRGVVICDGFVVLYAFGSYGRDKDGEVLFGSASVSFNGKNLIGIHSAYGNYLAPRDYKRLCGVELDETTLEHWALSALLFKKYAEVEVVEAKMGKKVEIPDSKEKLLWEFDMPATYIDCSWFREIVRREGFMVRGHFRLQPFKKNGEWTKKLIYIEPFQKHGYTRRAKIDLTKTD